MISWKHDAVSFVYSLLRINQLGVLVLAELLNLVQY